MSALHGPDGSLVDTRDGPPVSEPLTFGDADALVEHVVGRVGKQLVVGSPLGLGKARRILDALYRLATGDPQVELVVHTALGLLPPESGSELEARLRDPMNQRLFGGYAPPQMITDMRHDALPGNVTVHSFFFEPGAALGSRQARMGRVNSNYSDVGRRIDELDLNVFVQMVAPGEQLSLSCNPDLTLPLLEFASERRSEGRELLLCAEINRNLPWMGGAAAVEPDEFDLMLDAPTPDPPLFVVPNMPVGKAEHAIGARTAALVADEGTLQLGIGALSDAVVWMLLVRNDHPEAFRSLLDTLMTGGSRERGSGTDGASLVEQIGGTGPFEQGLYGSSEMLVPGFLELFDAGILRRRVHEDIEIERAAAGGGEIHSGSDTGVVMHAGFFLGPAEFYERLREMSPERRALIEMTGIDRVNTLDDDIELRTLQRRGARFINTALQVSLDGGAASDTLDDGRVLSGVGGQFDFVEMARRLPGARSIMLVRAVRDTGRATSNIVMGHPYVTIPAHLRDIVVTEYGVADLRNQPDDVVAARLIEIADSRFQDELVAGAVAAGRLPADHRVPEGRRHNSPEELARWWDRHPTLCPELPLGSGITDVEVGVGRALRHLDRLQSAPDPRKLDPRALLAALRPPRAARPFLDRIGLAHPRDLSERVQQRAVVYALAASGVLRDGSPIRRPPPVPQLDRPPTEEETQ